MDPDALTGTHRDAGEVSAMHAIPVFYTPAQTAAENDSVSPSAQKPAEAVASWQALGVPLRMVGDFPPVTREDFALAHKRRMVDEILDLRSPNGFDNRSPEVARTLPWTTGSMLAAAREALANGRVAVSPTSGFHHAEYLDCHPGMFCTFNGLMVTALRLRAEGAVARVGILDLDQHNGNGTTDIVRRLGLDWVAHYTLGGHCRATAMDPWLDDDLPGIVRGFSGCLTPFHSVIDGAKLLVRRWRGHGCHAGCP